MSVDKKADLFLNIRRLMDVSRCNNFHKINSEDVAQHSYYVGVLSYIIGYELGEKGFSVNTELLLERSLFHDVDEAFFSDIPRNIKHYNSDINTGIENAISSSLDNIFNDTGTVGDIIRYNRDHAKDPGIEGDIIDAVDMLELAIYCAEEYTLGNVMMEPLLDKAIKILESKSCFVNLLANSETFAGLYNILYENIDDKEEMAKRIAKAQNID